MCMMCIVNESESYNQLYYTNQLHDQQIETKNIHISRCVT